LRNAEEKYDAIYADFPLPFDHDLLKLYSKEIYSAILTRLEPDGYLALDSGMSFLDPQTPRKSEGFAWNMILLNTLKAAGFKTIKPFLGNELFIVARRDQQKDEADFKDLGIPLVHLNQEKLDFAREAEHYFEENPNFVNSIFRPRLGKLREPNL
jgi:predicted membrane-bound spermidine synthase